MGKEITMNKRIKSIFAVYAIVLVAFCVLYFVIPFPKSGAAWAAFAFAVVSIIGGCGISWYAFKNEGLKSKIYGFPMFRIGFAYTIIQMLFGLIIMIAGSFVTVPVWIPVAVSVVILALTGIGLIGTDNARDIITEQQMATQAAVKQMKMFRLDMQYIVDTCTDPELKKPLEKLADSFRYSDPVSNDELTEIEANLQSQVKNLAALVNTDKEAAQTKITEVSNLLADRNRRCKELKS